MDKIVFKGVPASAGISVGKIIYIKDINYEINDGLADESQIESQITNLEVAICKTFIEIYDLKDGFRGILSEEENRIFEFYKEILDDKSFFDEIKNTINQKRYYADNAIYTCIQKYIDSIEESDNDYFKQRIVDLNDVRKRLIKNIYNESEVNFDEIDSSHIVAVRELNPIIAGVLSKKEVKGVIAQEGAGYFSHASIILRSIGIPTLSNIIFKDLIKYKDQQAVIDCNKGILIVNPDNMDICDYHEKLKIINAVKSNVDPLESHEPAITRDGQRINLYASISSLKEFNIARAANFDGIGLVRTESLFINYRRAPDEKKQFLIYSKIAKVMNSKLVVIRTADIGGDKVPGTLNLHSELPGYSSRGIKRSLEHKQELTIQIRSIIRAAAFGNVSITFPMVNSADEIREVKTIINDIMKEKSTSNVARSNNVKMGAFIETISAVNDLNDILREVDFISIGTNDLLHQFCGLSRKCSTIEKRNYLDPEFISMVKSCVDTAKAQNKSVSICGEMACDPATAVVLLGMGVKDLSLTPGAYKEIYRLIRLVDYNNTREVTESAIQSIHIDRVKELLADYLKKLSDCS